MRKRDHFHPCVDASGDYIVEVSRGQNRRKLRISRVALAAGGALLSLVATGIVGGAGYLIFRDKLLANLMQRQTRMQYAYEDRIAALRLRLDQLASRQFIDQDGVEGKVQSLVVRQAQLETRAAVVAQLVESAVSRDMGATTTSAVGLPPPLGARAPRTAAALPIPAGGAETLGDAGKPVPEGLELRLGDDPASEPTPLNAPPAPEGRPRRDMSMAPQTDALASLAQAADPRAPMPERLENLARSLDRIEREQARRLSGLVRPAVEAAMRLRQAFDIAGLPVERFIAKIRRKSAGAAVGGPFVAAPEMATEGLFEQNLAAAQTALATLDGLRRALPMTPLRKPLPGSLQLTSAFGYRTDPFFGRPALHSGVDLRDDYGAPVRATAAGVVTVAGPQGGYGNLVEIDHGGGMATRYGHLSAINVAVGQQLTPGALVGRVGSTGRSTGPHLHYEVRIDGEAVDPARFLKASALVGTTP